MKFTADEKLSALPRFLSWTHHCILLAQCKTSEERYFYAASAIRAGWSTRQLENDIQRCSFERTMLADIKLAPPVRVLYQGEIWGVSLVFPSFSNLSRESLYRMLSKRGNPEIKSLFTLLHTMGLRLAVEAETHSCKAA
ncbi:MAG TPA: DUF1016 N-terminal domain-containing protein [Geobacteraceae bacterium]|nr:DUF1016 N-terminal domain-containing protein [Geobacteraceae bacterium]